MSIQIVVHCYAAKIPHYADHLRYQIASILKHTLEASVVYSVCYTESDEKTVAVLNEFEPEFKFEHIQLQRYPMEERRLWRRSIGRNELALQSQSDLVYFTDVDYVFSDFCLDSLWQQYKETAGSWGLAFPKTAWSRMSRKTAIRYIENPPRAVDYKQKPLVDPCDFRTQTFFRAIGGIQIVCGNYCRTYGYLNDDSRYQQIRKDDRPFFDYKEDVLFRRPFYTRGKQITPIRLPSLFRLGHLQRAR